jgi:hypothetical protein
MLDLPQLVIDLPEWQDHHFRSLRHSASKIERLAKKAGKGSARFENTCYQLDRVIRSGNRVELFKLINKPIDARAFTYLIATDSTLVEKLDFDESLLQQLLAVRSPLSRLTLMQLIRIFFTYYDQLTSPEGLETWCVFIKSQLSKVELSKGESDIKTYSLFKDRLFSPEGPAGIAEYARQREWDLDTLLKKFSLTGFSNGRYINLCRYQYYLETLSSISVGEEHPILDELCKPDVANAAYNNSKLLGHACLEILIDRTEDQLISKSWQAAILSIAGDPRVPKSNKNYQQWWSLLGDARIAKMRGWLSRFDLKLFLSVLEQSAKDGGNNAMERMFVPRKAFMEGLLNQGLVTSSRLFLSAEAESYLARNYEKRELPEFARVSSANTSMIYLCISDRMHMVEGSHNFKVKFFDKIPSKVNLADYGTKVIADRELRGDLSSNYYREFGNDDGFIELPHDIHLNWQQKAIEFLRYHDISVEPGEVIPKDLYRRFKWKFENQRDVHRGHQRRYY